MRGFPQPRLSFYEPADGAPVGENTILFLSHCNLKNSMVVFLLRAVLCKVVCLEIQDFNAASRIRVEGKALISEQKVEWHASEAREH